MTNSPFVIKQINMFTGWVYNLPKNNECTICRCNLNTPSLYNQEKGIESYIVSGVCLHSFHQECIKPWVDKNKHCPICSAQWQYSNNSNNYKEKVFITKQNLNKEQYSDMKDVSGNEFNDLPALVSMSNESNSSNINNKYMTLPLGVSMNNDGKIQDDMKYNIEKYINKYTSDKSNINKKTNIKTCFNCDKEGHYSEDCQNDNNIIINNIIHSPIITETKKIKIIKKIMDTKVDFIDKNSDYEKTKVEMKKEILKHHFIDEDSDYEKTNSLKNYIKKNYIENKDDDEKDNFVQINKDNKNNKMIGIFKKESKKDANFKEKKCKIDVDELIEEHNKVNNNEKKKKCKIDVDELIQEHNKVYNNEKEKEKEKNLKTINKISDLVNEYESDNSEKDFDNVD